MCEKIKKYWEDLNVDAVVNKRELLLGVAACTLAGLVVGMFCSPRTNLSVSPQMNIGSNNASNNTDNGNSNSVSAPDDGSGDEIEE